MSTSLIYHAWNGEDYQLRSTKFVEGSIWFHLEKKPQKRACSRCGSTDVALAGRVDPPPELRALPIGKRPVWLVLHLHRVQCRNCQVVAQEPRGIADPKKHYTRQLARLALELCRRTTVSDVADYLGLSWDTVKEILKIDLEHRAERIHWRGLRYIAIDEVAVRKGQSYLAVVLNLETGRVLFVAESRRAEALAPFFKRLRRSRTKLTAVSMDMSGGFKRALELYYRRPCAIVYDRFHVVKLLNDAIDDIRRTEMRNARSETARKTIKGSRFLLLYGFENLRTDKHAVLASLLQANDALCKAYLLKEQLRLFWSCATKSGATKFLEVWTAAARATGLTQLIRFATTIQTHLEGILAYFDHPISTGPLEGVNNAIKVLKRKAYGFRDMAFFRLRILFIHECAVKFVGA